MEKKIMHACCRQGRQSEANLAMDESFTKYLVILLGFLLNGQVFGHAYAMSFLYSELLKRNPEQEFHISLMLSIIFGLTLFCGVFMVIFLIYIPERWIFLIGLAIFGCSPIVCAFVEDVRFWYITYTLPRGLAGAMLYFFCFYTAAKAFPNYICIASAIVSQGASIFTIVVPIIIENLLSCCGLFRFLIIDGLYLFCFMIFAPIYRNNLNADGQPISTKSLITNWWPVFKVKKFIYLILISLIMLPFNNIPYVHSYNYLEQLSSNVIDHPMYAMSALGVGAFIIKIVAAVLADVKKLSVLLLFKFAILSFGIGLTLFGLLTYIVNYHHILYTIVLYVGSFALGMGEGCIWSLIYPVCYECAKPVNNPSIFCIYCSVISVPYSLGGPFATLLYSKLNSYPIAFFIGGGAFLLSANLFWLIDSKIFDKEESEKVEIIIELLSVESVG